MNIDDNGDFRRRLITLAELFDLKLSPTRQALYFEALRDLPFEAVCSGLNQAARASTFFPKPAELRVFAVGDAEDIAETAWMAMKQAMKSAGSYASLIIADAALGDTIMAMFGSWPNACSQELSSEMWASKRKEFSRVYRVLRNRGLNGSRYLTGICEQQNAGRKDWLQFVPVHRLAGAELEQLTLEAAEVARTSIAAAAHGFQRLSDGENLSGLTSQESA